ncbi:MAG: response regulator, partial [Bdellovibrionales bacterium]|nr:response regulator [Bdellovibrionales bacterium]
MASILIVDDSLAMRSSMELILKQYGYQVTARENGREALNFARGTPVDAVITDLNMPEMNGMSLVSSLR